MKKRSYILVAAIAAVSLGAAGCGSDGGNPTTEKSRAQTEWEQTSEQEREETCTWYKFVGEEEAFKLLTSMKEGSESEQDVQEVIDLMNEECK